MFMKKILQFKLKLLAKLYLWRWRPRVVGITGSVGKTSTKDAISLVLGDKMRVRISAKSYNNQIGLPLTILGFETAGRNIFGWLGLLIRAFGRIIYDSNFPQILVLEMGSDRPGDLRYLTSIVKPNVSVITNVAPVHLQAFKNLDNVVKEKSILIENLNDNDWAILNYDDGRVRAMANATRAKKIFYGTSKGADIWASNIKFSELNLIFNIHSDNQIYNFQLRGAGEHLIYLILAAFSVAQIFKINPKIALANLARFQPLAGRGRFLEGKNNNLVIDESYNASPMSVASALDLLNKIETDKKKVVVLGDMKELGEKSVEFHQALADKMDFVDQIIFVGPEIKVTHEMLKTKLNVIARSEATQFRHMTKLRILDYKSGQSVPNLSYFEDVDQFKKELDQLIKSDSLILIKGSQAIRLEKIVEKLISSRYNKKEVLVRQSEEWNK